MKQSFTSMAWIIWAFDSCLRNLHADLSLLCVLPFLVSKENLQQLTIEILLHCYFTWRMALSKAEEQISMVIYVLTFWVAQLKIPLSKANEGKASCFLKEMQRQHQVPWTGFILKFSGGRGEKITYIKSQYM